MKRKLLMTVLAALGFAATARADGSWIRFVFRQASGLQLGELAVYDHEGTRLNLSPTNKGVDVDPTTLTAKSYTFTPSCNSSAGPGNAFDGSLYSKWFQNRNSSTSDSSSWMYLTMRVADGAYPRGYNMATGEDCVGRSPTYWTVQASTNGTDWLDVDVKENVSYPSRTYTWWNDGNMYTFRYPWQPFYVERVVTNVPYSATGDMKCGVLVTDSRTGATLAEGSDYSVAYADNSGIGTASVTVTGLRGDYTDVTDTWKYAIVPAFNVTMLRDHVPYRGGEPCACGVVVSNFANTAELVEGTDYTVSYANNTAVGTASVTVTGLNAYAGNTDTQNFTITELGVWAQLCIMQNAAPNSMIQLSEFAIYEEEGTRLNTSTTAKNYYEIPDLPAKSHTASGQGQIASSVNNLFDSNTGSKWCVNVSGLTVANGSSKWIYITMRLADGTRPLAYNFATANDCLERSPTWWTFSISTNGYDWTEVDRREGVSYPSKTYTWWNGGEPYRFEYPWIPFQDAVIATNMYYNGSERKCGVVVRDFWTKAVLTEDTDYELTYADNVEIGTASVTVTGLGKYAGATDVKHFTIKPAYSVYLKNTSVVYDYRTPAECGVVVTNAEGTAELVEGTDYSVTYVNNDRVGTATVQVSGLGSFEGNYKELSFTVTSSLKRIPARCSIVRMSSPTVPLYADSAFRIDDGNCSTSIDKPNTGTTYGFLLDYGTPRHVRAIAVAPRIDCNTGNSRYFKAWGSDDLANWELIHTNTILSTTGKLNEYAVSSGPWEVAAYRYLYVGNIGDLNICELATYTDELTVGVTANPDAFASTSPNSDDAADGVLVTGGVYATDATPATVEVFAATRDWGDDYAAWAAHGAKTAVEGTVTPGATFSARLAGLARGRYHVRVFASRGDVRSSSQPVPTVDVGTVFATPHVYVSRNDMGYVFNGGTGLGDYIDSSNWAIYDFSNVDFARWQVAGFRFWGRSGFYNRMIGRIDYGYGPAGLDWGETTSLVSDAAGRRVDYATAAPADITWVTSAESFANVVVQPTTLYYHPLLKLRQAKQPRYIRITGLDQWNIGEIEFRLLRRTGGTFVVR